VASPQEAAALIAAVPEDDRVFWGLAFYAGLRVGEILDLSWSEVNLGSGVLLVRDAWDSKQKVTVEPKSRAGKRRVPIAGVLRQILIDHRLRHGEEGDVVVERRYWRILRRAARAWKAAGLTPIRPHECRHTFASLMIAAGVNPKALAAYMGHSSVRTTYDLYGHLMPGSEKEVAELLDAYLRLSDDRARASAPQTAPQTGQKSADLQG
jgi:integrase